MKIEIEIGVNLLRLLERLDSESIRVILMAIINKK